jgi:hypothetical protein
MIMKSLLLNSQLFLYGPLFLLLANISGEEAPVPNVKKPLPVVMTSIPVKQDPDCMAALEEKNAHLKDDDNGILDKDEIEAYEKCIESVAPGLDVKNNMNDYYFLLDCYTNLMDYYDLVVHDEDKLDEIEDSIEEISVDE